MSRCARLSVVADITGCLRRSVSNFWSTELRQHVDEPVFAQAPASRIPAVCRNGITAAPAFTCRANLVLYLNKQLLDIVATRVPAVDRPYAFAVVQAHEIGHVVQNLLHQPQAASPTPTAAQTRFVEEQADCLSGVWADHEAGRNGLDVTEFTRVARQMLTLLNTRAEQQTHGTTAQRSAAIDNGLRHGDPKDCQLVTFT
jgi:uncharacterized protein